VQQLAADSWDPTMLGLLFRPLAGLKNKSTRGPLAPTARHRRYVVAKCLVCHPDLVR
jgi:hypothetical protein